MHHRKITLRQHPNIFGIESQMLDRSGFPQISNANREPKSMVSPLVIQLMGKDGQL